MTDGTDNVSFDIGPWFMTYAYRFVSRQFFKEKFNGIKS